MQLNFNDEVPLSLMNYATIRFKSLAIKKRIVNVL